MTCHHACPCCQRSCPHRCRVRQDFLGTYLLRRSHAAKPLARVRWTEFGLQGSVQVRSQTSLAYCVSGFGTLWVLDGLASHAIFPCLPMFQNIPLLHLLQLPCKRHFVMWRSMTVFVTRGRPTLHIPRSRDVQIDPDCNSNDPMMVMPCSESSTIRRWLTSCFESGKFS